VGVFIACLMCVIVGAIVSALMVWTSKVRLLEQEQAALKKRLDEGDPLIVRVERLEFFMRPSAGELAPRLAQLEIQQAVDSQAFAAQARIHHRRIGELDERLQYMARDMRSDRTTVGPPKP